MPKRPQCPYRHLSGHRVDCRVTPREGCYQLPTRPEHGPFWRLVKLVSCVFCVHVLLLLLLLLLLALAVVFSHANVRLYRKYKLPNPQNTNLFDGIAHRTYEIDTIPCTFTSKSPFPHKVSSPG